MTSVGSDLVGVVEALYRFDLSNHEWLSLVAGQVAPLVDPYRKGVVAMGIACDDPMAFAPTCVVELDMPDAVRTLFRQGVPGIPPEYIADGYLSRPWCFSADLAGWERIPGVSDGAAAAQGMLDLLGLGAAEPDGRGCWFGAFQAERRRLPGDVRMALTHIGRHLKVANRLRRKLDDGKDPRATPGAVITADGRVVHAVGDARNPSVIEKLTHTSRAMDAARTRRGRADALRAVQAWRAQVGDDWTLVDSFERDGRRYILAVENREPAPGFHLLSVREREVIRQALLGRDNKAIAYEMGLAQSTVRVLMARAAVKVGARSRRDLLHKAMKVQTPSRATRNR